MAKFIFKMEQLLNIKRQLEASVKNELANAIRSLEYEKQLLKDLESSRIDYKNDIKQSMQEGIAVQKLKEFNAFMEALDTKIINQKKEVKDAQKVVDNIREKLVSVVKEKKILEKLKEKKYQEYILEQQKKDELELSEIANYKYIEHKVGDNNGNN